MIEQLSMHQLARGSIHHPLHFCLCWFTLTCRAVGRRLENLSWRLWQRGTFAVGNEEKTAPTTRTLPQNILSESRIPDLPQLSGSVESLVDGDAVGFASESAPPRSLLPELSMKSARLAPGGSCPSSEQDQSLSNSKPTISIINKPVYQIGGSSEECHGFITI
ncbi:putative MFS-type transporter EfpA [Fusarium oxysporum f. sp. albedinis]|nr:putative MFS-type transporter EfpA [Fusarium oxysporum f. sp. albedinis]